MKLGKFLKWFVSFRRSSQVKAHYNFDFVSHDIGNEVIGKHIVDAMQTNDIAFVEGSIYLGGFLPDDIPQDKILVWLEPPTLFTSVTPDSPSHLYAGGRSIPEASRGLRRMFETIASDIERGLDRRTALRTVYDLLYFRRKSPDVVVYNEPKAWLRTVWYEADLMLQYMLLQGEYPLFGAFVYSDMDAAFGSFLEQHGNALSAMTGDDCLLLAFDGRGGRDCELHTASEYIAYRAVLEAPRRLEEPMSPAELDGMRAKEACMLAGITGVNRSLLFGRRLGVRADETPCIVFWRSLAENRILTVPLALYVDDDTRSKAMKTLAGVIADVAALPDGDALNALEQRIAALPGRRLVETIDSVGNLVRAFLEKNTPPLRDRMTIEDIDNFERVKAVSPFDVAQLLGADGFLHLPEDDIQRALEEILNVPFHKKDWGGEINDLYTANVTINGVRIPTAFLLKGSGLRRAEMRIADCGKNGDQLLRLFESPAYLFVVQFVGRVSEAVIADLQGKVAQRHAAGKPAWFLVMDAQDTARLMYAYGKLR